MDRLQINVNLLIVLIYRGKIIHSQTNTLATFFLSCNQKKGSRCAACHILWIFETVIHFLLYILRPTWIHSIDRTSHIAWTQIHQYTIDIEPCTFHRHATLYFTHTLNLPLSMDTEEPIFIAQSNSPKYLDNSIVTYCFLLKI